MTKTRYVVDLFAGCGGLSLGLEYAGFTPLLVNELNKDAMDSYLANRVRQYSWLARPEFHSYDVKSLVSDEDGIRSRFVAAAKAEHSVDLAAGDLDLLVGGPPCQGYSGIGHRRSYSVDKEQLPSNHLYQDMAYLVSQFKPKVFMFENVRGLLSARWTSAGKKGEIWNDVLSVFRGIPGYDVKFSLVHAKDYGVPQNRPRVLLVGVRKDIGVSHDAGEHDAVKGGFLPEGNRSKRVDLVDLLGDLIDPGYAPGSVTPAYPSDPKNEVQTWFRTSHDRSIVAAAGAPVSEHEYSNHSEHVVERFAAMHKSGGEIPPHLRTKKFAQRLLPSCWGEQGPTITAASLPDDFVHFEQPRTMTVREWARLQTFPDWYEFAGKRTTGGIRRAGNPREGIFDRELPKYTQIGNAVPVWLARAVGEHFAALLQGK